MPIRLLAVLLAGATLVLAACGGASREEFAAEANAVCRDIERDLQSLDQGQVRSIEQVQQRVEGLTAKLGEAKRRLADVERPGGDDGEAAERYVTEFGRRSDAASQALRGLVPAARARDQAAFRRITAQLQALSDDRLTRLARDAGATACADS